MTRGHRLLILVGLGLLAAPSAWGWGEKGHRLVNRLAAQSLPREMPLFFRRAVLELEYLGYDPDRWRSPAEPALNAVNAPDHFINLEYVEGRAFPPDRYQFLHGLIERGLVRGEVALTTVGFLPYRIVELAELLRVQFRLWRQAPHRTARERAERHQIERNIIVIAGVLGHFVADGAQPHHTTVHYDGWNTAFAPNPRGYTTERGIHLRFENDFVNEAIRESDVRSRLRPPRRLGPLFEETMRYLRESHARVDQLYELDRQGGFAPGSTHPEAKRFAAERLAAAAHLLASIWYTAWVESASPSVPDASSSSPAPSVTAPKGDRRIEGANTEDQDVERMQSGSPAAAQDAARECGACGARLAVGSSP
ncbi:hypothetical protein HRbin10_02334 [bacterium HR10]|nr:hypothetical protein HRbin10_02334 [bacterium HR10]